MACTLTCITLATCKVVDGGQTCRCNDGYKGNGFVKCEVASPGHLDEHYILMIILVILLFVGLVVLMIYFLCKRKYGDYSRPLVGSEVKDPYDEKWDGLFHEMSAKTDTYLPTDSKTYSANVPPPYNGIHHDEPSASHMTSFNQGGGGPPDGAVEPGVVLEIVDEFKEVDNPTYATVSRTGDAGIEADYDNPVYEDEEEADCAPPTVEDVAVAVEEECTVEVATVEECEPVVEPESAPEAEAPTEVVMAVESATDPADDVQISVSRTGEDEDTITATISTPNVTVNLNINVPIPPYVYSSQESFLDKANAEAATNM